MTYLTEREVAARWKCGASTVRRLRERGRLPYFRVGLVIRYDVLDVERFELEQTVDAVVVGLRRRGRA